MIRRTLAPAVLLALLLALAAPGVSGAATHPKVGPHQVFAGLVNGSLGRPSPAVIQVVCPGPATPGQTGRPVSGQTVAVTQAVSTAAVGGFTGNDATSIAVFFGAPPPTAAGPGQVRFGRYGVTKPIPTNVRLPCFGAGVVTFVPLPGSPPTSRSAGVPVTFENLAVTPA